MWRPYEVTIINIASCRARSVLRLGICRGLMWSRGLNPSPCPMRFALLCAKLAAILIREEDVRLVVYAFQRGPGFHHSHWFGDYIQSWQCLVLIIVDAGFMDHIGSSSSARVSCIGTMQIYSAQSYCESSPAGAPVPETSVSRLL